MFDVNTGIVDRVIRVLVGLALIAGFFYWTDWAWRWVFWIGVIPLITGLVGMCPIYRLMGWNTADKSGGNGTAAKT